MVMMMCICTCANTPLSVGHLLVEEGRPREGGRGGGRRGGRELGEEGMREEEGKREREREGGRGRKM